MSGAPAMLWAEHLLAAVGPEQFLVVKEEGLESCGKHRKLPIIPAHMQNPVLPTDGYTSGIATKFHCFDTPLRKGIVHHIV